MRAGDARRVTARGECKIQYRRLPESDSETGPGEPDQFFLELYGLQEHLESLVELRRVLRRTRDLDSNVRPWDKNVQRPHNHLRL